MEEPGSAGTTTVLDEEGIEVEVETSAWKRDFFPGQPFKKNQFLPGARNDDERKPRFVCTPSFYGAGESNFGKQKIGFMVVVGVGVSLLLGVQSLI